MHHYNSKPTLFPQRLTDLTRHYNSNTSRLKVPGAPPMPAMEKCSRLGNFTSNNFSWGDWHSLNHLWFHCTNEEQVKNGRRRLDDRREFIPYLCDDHVFCFMLVVLLHMHFKNGTDSLLSQFFLEEEERDMMCIWHYLK